MARLVGGSVTGQQTAPPARRLGRSAVGWVISIACLAFIASKVDLGQATRALQAYSWPYLVPALAGLAFGYCQRVIRWAVMLSSAGEAVNPSRCAAPFLGSITLNNVLPLRAGDIVRATVFPAAIGVPRTAAIGSIVLERLLDLLTLAFCLTVGATVLGGVKLPTWLVDGTVLLVVVGGLILLAVLLFSGPIARRLSQAAKARSADDLVAKLLRAGASMLDGFRQMSAPRPLFAVLVLSLLAWLGEATCFYFVMLGFGLTYPPVAALLVMAFVTLSTLVPSSPGYVGPFHLAAFSIMTLLGAREDVATSFAVISHLMLWVPTTVAGGIAMLLRPEIFRVAAAERSRGA